MSHTWKDMVRFNPLHRKHQEAKQRREFLERKWHQLELDL